MGREKGGPSYYGDKEWEGSREGLVVYKRAVDGLQMELRALVWVTLCHVLV
jgi:hypothetical protein